MAAVGRPLVAAALLVGAAASGFAQPDHDTPPRYPPTTRGHVLATNALIGGTVAATHAALGRRNPLKAFALGVVGGALHGFGKLAITHHDSSGVLTTAWASVGTSIVANAGRGIGPLDELYLPVGPARVRFHPRQADKVRFAININETWWLAVAALHNDRPLNVRSSIAAGTFVFDSWTPLPVSGANGMAYTSTITMAPRPDNPPQTFRHEVVHVRQHWFLDETVSRPIESWLRGRLPLVRRLPAWIEFGIVVPTIESIEGRTFRPDGPIRRWREVEAETLERRPAPFQLPELRPGSPGVSAPNRKAP